MTIRKLLLNDSEMYTLSSDIAEMAQISHLDQSLTELLSVLRAADEQGQLAFVSEAPNRSPRQAGRAAQFAGTLAHWREAIADRDTYFTQVP